MTNEQMVEQGKRLQQAREAKRYSRAALAEKAGLPMKSLEKYEAGTMDIPLSRLNALAGALELELGDLLYGVSPTTAQPTDAGFKKSLEDALNAIDTARTEGLETRWREVPNLIDDALGLLPRASLDDLASMASRRGLHQFSPTDWLEAISNADVDTAKTLTSDVEARIIDSAVLGLDLYSIDENQLSDIAETQDLEGDGWLGLGWSSKSAIVNALRPILFRLAMEGNPIDFDTE